jgi:hypothetical protein
MTKLFLVFLSLESLVFAPFNDQNLDGNAVEANDTRYILFLSLCQLTQKSKPYFQELSKEVMGTPQRDSWFASSKSTEFNDSFLFTKTQPIMSIVWTIFDTFFVTVIGWLKQTSIPSMKLWRVVMKCKP